jgi:hypothetical protein
MSEIWIFKRGGSVMKKEWIQPKAEIQEFVPNEYVAACGDSGKVYKFTCNAPAGILYYYPNDGNIDGNGNGRAQRLGSYHPCDATHEASSTNSFYDGFVDRNRNGRYDSGEGVIVWRGPNGNNGHATKNLNMDSWETAKS